MSGEEYIIRGGLPGRERLRILSRVLQPTTQHLFQQAGVSHGMKCLDLGCGGGDVSFLLASLTGPGGHVVGIDMDPAKIDLARKEAEDRKLSNASFIADDIFQTDIHASFDIVYARFLLTHLKDPDSALKFMYDHLLPGGTVIIEDIDFSGHFSYPVNPAFNQYVKWYCDVSVKAYGDPWIGAKLPSLLQSAGYTNVKLNIVQPAGYTGEVKVIAAITMENIADAVIHAGLATSSEIQQVLTELYRVAEDHSTLISMPRIMQVWVTRS